MNNVEDTLKFLFDGYEVLCFVCGTLIALFATLAISSNCYYKLNQRILKSGKILSKCGGDFIGFQRALPVIYQYQWQAYTRLSGVYPHQVFRFLPQKQRKPLSYLSGFATIVCLLVCVYGIARGVASDKQILTAICLFLGFCVVYSAVCVCNRVKEKRARALFASLVGYMDAYFGKNHCFDEIEAESKSETDELIKKINFLKQNGVPEDSAQKIGALLSAQSLNKRRSAAQQRQLNVALNGLVKVVSRDFCSLPLPTAEASDLS